MTTRAQRIQDLADKAKEYISKEKSRIEDAVKALESAENGRTGGSGIQESSKEEVSAVAQNDLASFLAS